MAGVELGAPAPRPKSAGKTKQDKRRRRVNWLIGLTAVLVILAGTGVIAVTWFYDEVDPADKVELQSNTILFGDGKQVLAKLGKENRQVVPPDQISEVVQQAVMAAEDKNFKEHGGIDLKGIARAAWNNFSGGSTQGASTITQQYARHAADLNEISYNRKIREAMLARKIEQEKSKTEILGLYLNAIYFGRGAHGIEAAALAYFGKSVLTKPGQKGALTFEEAAVLASVIKQPEPDPTTGHNGYDPQINKPEAEVRWAYTLDNMLEKAWITPEQRASAKYPAVSVYNPKKQCTISCGVDKPTGAVINRVREELKAMNINMDKGGYRITTTIDPVAQKAAENAARRLSKESPMNKLSDKYMAALVAVDNLTGRVLAYYGGENGTGTDYAGLNEDEKTGTKFGGHPPGSTFKVFTLAAALKENVSFDSRWDSTLPDKTGKKINNSERDPNCGKSCDLEQATIQSFNFPFYWIADGLKGKVVEAARDAGIRWMWPDGTPGKPDNPVDLTNFQPDEKEPFFPFDRQSGFGQYRVTVLDQANGMATLAHRGVYNKAHFVRSVERIGPDGKWQRERGEQLKPRQVFDPNQMDNLNGVLQKIPGSSGKALSGGRPAAGKTGTWELGKDKRANAHAWMIGGTPQISAAVWVGGKDGDVAIVERDGRSKMFGAGTPATIWKQFMDEVHEKLKLPVKRFPERKSTGDPKVLANGVPAVQKVDPNNPFCVGPNPDPRFCPQAQDDDDRNEDDDRNNGNGNGNNNGNGNGNGIPNPFGEGNPFFPPNPRDN